MKKVTFAQIDPMAKKVSKLPDQTYTTFHYNFGIGDFLILIGTCFMPMILWYTAVPAPLASGGVDGIMIGLGTIVTLTFLALAIYGLCRKLGLGSDDACETISHYDTGTLKEIIKQTQDAITGFLKNRDDNSSKHRKTPVLETLHNLAS